jgi:uncharacterized membrane protein
MLGIVGNLLLSSNQKNDSSSERKWGNALLYILAAFILGTIACVNPWDMPVYALILGVALIIHKLQELRVEPKRVWFISLAFTLLSFVLLCGLGYFFYWPFYATYQQLYVNGLGLVSKGTSLGDYLTISGLWIFIALSYFLLELYRWWARMQNSKASAQGRNTLVIGKVSTRYLTGCLLLCGAVLIFAALLGLKILLALLIVLGLFLFVTRLKETRLSKFDAETRFIYILLLLGLCISLGLEVVYVRDFLDGGDYERMNTVFKFSIQAWLCFAIGGALAVHRLWYLLRGYLRKAWIVALFLLVLGGSVFLTVGTASRIRDHQVWVDAQPPAQSASYTPTVDGLAFIRTWYPGDASAIAWLNANVAGSPVILEAAAPVSYQWFNRVSI